MSRIFLSVFVPVFLVEIATNSAWIMVSYDWRVRSCITLSYTLSIAAGALSGMAWAYMALNIKNDDMYFANVAWDVMVTIVFFTIPVIAYGFKMDQQTLIGAVIAIAGLLLMKA